ncbi:MULTISPECIES: MarR family winged helix-turn-helix transcriptional regulator [unclassified Streptomyces]|uniref:MarR family winged helix-turn-helix transcriptional regulator n=1 Tax=unclassified Streptomyces TaxID=2593676 RepID=UPI002E759F21|nr:MarR family winged helix-turn-helix transcriptional regulator [Streptomyces sp. JV176]MEE1804286.1 MarR family winged helix-turn-helix transcriptional regulator [Streptomyces sp. JV176]
MSASMSEQKKPNGQAEEPALDTDLGWAIRMVSSAFRRVATESVAALPGGARAYLVLVALAAGEPPSQLALAKEVSLDRTVMTYLLDDLEAHELVTRRPDPRDRRARQVLITDTGRARLGQVRQDLAAAEGRLLVDLDDHDAAQLRTLLSRVARTAQREAIAPDEEGC